jgi:putative transferase (TIGR04331 family)
VVARFLVTTALEDTWPADDVPVLFLGEWCRHYERKSAWEKRDAVVAPYHWDDRQKLHRDYLYLQGLYEELLRELAAQLNELHRVDHSLRYWRILVGPWLGYFIQMLFDRWSMLQQVLRDEDIAGVRVLQHPEGDLVPNDMGTFTPMFIGDAWNESIYGQILDLLAVPVEKVALKNQALPAGGNRGGRVSAARRLKRGLARVASHLSGILCRVDEYFFIASYLGIEQDLRLQAKLGQLPKLWRPVAVPECPFDPAARQWQLPKAANTDEFAPLARAMIPCQIPKAYLEGYPALVFVTKKLPWPRKPKAIFTSNSFNADDTFKAWAAMKIESGTPLVIGQHGGNYGMALWGFTEDHQISIADRFLTWGWNEPASSNITPIGNFKGFSRSLAPDAAGVALLVEMAIPLFSYHMYSAPVAAGQWLSYFDDQCRFVETLPEELRDQLLVRLYSSDYGLGQRQRWQDRFPDVRLDNGAQPMARLLNKTRLYISTYNATTYLESLSLNFPTIMFWNTKHWELRDSALPYFEQLKSVGIFHETPEGAARQMAAIWHDVPGWWQSAEVQTVRQAFCERYARIPEKPLEIMANIFRTIAH